MMRTPLSTPLKTQLRTLLLVPRSTTVRRVLYFCLLLCTALHTTAPVVFAATNVPACGFAEIRGVITAQDTGQPLPNVSVFASGQSSSTSATSDATGAYTATVPYYRDPGPYRVSTYASFFSELPTGAYLTAPSTTTQVISGSTTNLDFQLARGGDVKGQIRTADTNLPMEGVLLSVYRIEEGEPILNDSVNSDADGNYAIYGLEAGMYTLRYDTRNLFSTAEIYPYETGYLGRVNYVSQATTFNVAASVTTTVNFSISYGSEIVGEIRRSDTNGVVPAVNVHAYLLDEDGEGRGELVNASDGSSFGLYEVGGLSPGKYLLFAQTSRTDGAGGVQYHNTWDLEMQWYQNAVVSSAAQVVEIPEIGASQVISANFLLTPGAWIKGVVTDADSGQPVEGIEVSVSPFTPTQEINFFYDFSFGAVTNADGEYEIAGLYDGKYQLFTGPDFDSDYNTIGRTDFGSGPEVAVQGTEVKEGANLTVRKGGNISGTLTNDQGQPVPNIQVTLVTSDTRFLRSTTSDASGNYGFSRVYPGQYRIKYDRFDPCGCYNNEFYTGEGSGEDGLITVAVGQTLTGIDVSMECNAPPPANALFMPRLIVPVEQ